MVGGHHNAFSPPAASRVNAPVAGGNPRTVLNFTRTLALALGLGLLSGGCAGQQTPSGSLVGLRAGTTTLRITNHVSAPVELDGVTVAIDGEPLALSSVPPPGGAAATVGSLGLAPGAHTITVRARAETRGAEVIVVGAHQPFLVERGAAAITIDVRSGIPGSAAAAPLAVTLTMLGGRLSPELGVLPSEDKDERCAALLPIPRALCRAAVDLEDAARRNDVAATLCLRDKIAEMRILALVGDSGKGESVPLAEAAVGKVARLLDRCGGEAVSSARPDGVSVTRVGTK